MRKLEPKNVKAVVDGRPFVQGSAWKVDAKNPTKGFYLAPVQVIVVTLLLSRTLTGELIEEFQRTIATIDGCLPKDVLIVAAELIGVAALSPLMHVAAAEALGGGELAAVVAEAWCQTPGPLPGV